MLFRVVKCTYLVLLDTWMFYGVFVLRVRLANWLRFDQFWWCMWPVFIRLWGVHAQPSMNFLMYHSNSLYSTNVDMPWYPPVKIARNQRFQFWKKMAVELSPENASYYLRLQSSLPQEADPSYCTSHAGVDELHDSWERVEVWNGGMRHSCLVMFGIGTSHLNSCGVFFLWNSWRIFTPHVKGLRVDQLIAPDLQFGEWNIWQGRNRWRNVGDFRSLHVPTLLSHSAAFLTYAILDACQTMKTSLELLLVSHFHHDIKNWHELTYLWSTVVPISLQAQGGDLVVGAHVRLIGLSQAHFNGLEGYVTGAEGEKPRKHITESWWDVLLNDL